jgi:hypothetical protein
MCGNAGGSRFWTSHFLGYSPVNGSLLRLQFAEEIRYGLNHWDGLTRFLDDGRIELDTNIVERGIRPIVLNRKNALSPAMTKARRAGPVSPRLSKPSN